MTKFLVLYRSPVSAQQRIAGASPEEAKAGMDAWMNWKNKNEDLVADFGMPLGDTKVLQGESVSEGDSIISGYTIVQGESMDFVLGKLKDHPHFMTSGSSIEVHEFLPMPGM